MPFLGVVSTVENSTRSRVLPAGPEGGLTSSVQFSYLISAVCGVCGGGVGGPLRRIAISRLGWFLPGRTAVPHNKLSAGGERVLMASAILVPPTRPHPSSVERRSRGGSGYKLLPKTCQEPTQEPYICSFCYVYVRTRISQRVVHITFCASHLRTRPNVAATVRHGL